MNPHFMFNAMSVLIHMINIAPKKKAEEFAISFAKLMRQVLDQSKKSFISIEEEINTLDNYLFIQKQRLGSDFGYIINCPANLKKIQIPTMLLQPLIENAIIHGVSQISYPGKVDIAFSGSARYWQVDISDNGKGIKSVSNSSKKAKKTSVGISLVEKKLELLRTRYGIHIDITFSEIDHELGTGTRVTLRRKEA
jgi:LytS/YehU family sensor histidine kinase